MDKEAMQQLFEASYAAAGFAGIYRDALLKAGFTREEACTMATQLIIAMVTGNNKK